MVTVRWCWSDDGGVSDVGRDSDIECFTEDFFFWGFDFVPFVILSLPITFHHYTLALSLQQYPDHFIIIHNGKYRYFSRVWMVNVKKWDKVCKDR